MVKKVLTSRRGVALEYAIIIMLVIMGLSTIILTNTMLQASHRNRIEANFYAEMDLDSIGASFIEEISKTDANLIEWETKWEEKYDITVEGFTLTVMENNTKDNATPNVLLYIEAKKLGLTVTVEKWERYK